MLRILLPKEITSTFYLLLAFTIFPVNTIFGMSTHKDRLDKQIKTMKLSSSSKVFQNQRHHAYIMDK